MTLKRNTLRSNRIQNHRTCDILGVSKIELAWLKREKKLSVVGRGELGNNKRAQKNKWRGGIFMKGSRTTSSNRKWIMIVVTVVVSNDSKKKIPSIFYFVSLTRDNSNKPSNNKKNHSFKTNTNEYNRFCTIFIIA